MSKCPACGSDDTDGDKIAIDDELATQERWCLKCKSMWTNLYKLLHQVISHNSTEETTP